MLEIKKLDAPLGAEIRGLDPRQRLDAATIAFQFDHGDAKVLIVDREFSPVVKAALALCKAKPLVIDYDDPEYSGSGERLGRVEYEDFIASGDPNFAWEMPNDEWDAITLNYTSGTTGDPKGVVSNARQVYLNSLGQITTWALPRHPVFLWTLPMFHAVGWCAPYSMVVMAGVQVCLRKIDPADVFRLIDEHGVTHLCAAPIVLNTLLTAFGTATAVGARYCRCASRYA